MVTDRECPKCKADAIERRENQFYYHGKTAPGWVCTVCGGLWPIAGEEIGPLKARPDLAERMKR